MRPRLPSAREIFPYLEFIDEKGWYSNYGALVTLLEAKFSQHLGCDGPATVTAASATAGITATLLALQIPEGSLCVVPAWTFVATPHAIRAAGLAPFFHDVDRQTWALDPEQVRENLRRMPATVRAVMAVSPFGAPIDTNAWEAFQDQTGIPVLIDAAAAFDTVHASRIPSIVSLHATKILAAGEGGFIATTDTPLLERIRACSNFGFAGSRTAMCQAVNSKMSEYHAAVALADLYRWPGTRLKQVQINAWYRQALKQLNGVSLQPGYGDGWVGGTTNILLPTPSLAQISHQLLEQRVDSRSWWGAGCHVQPAFIDCPRGDLTVTEELASRVLGLPHFRDMEEGDVYWVIEALAKALRCAA
jgi:dTDP-4-amino-4,6-dideoxygalactose transaminase